MNYVLLFYAWSAFSYPISLATADFQTKEACEQAGREFQNIGPKTTWGQPSSRFSCVSKVTP